MEKHLGSIYCPLYGVTRCPLWRGSECTEVYGETIWTQSLSVISQVSAVEGCPLSGVPLYTVILYSDIILCYYTVILYSDIILCYYTVLLYSDIIQ